MHKANNMILMTDKLAYQNTAAIKKIETDYRAKIILIEDVRSFLGIISLLRSCLQLLNSKDVFLFAIGQPEVNLLTALLFNMGRKKIILYLPELYDDRWGASAILKATGRFLTTIILPSREREKIFAAKYFVPNKCILMSNNVYQKPPMKPDGNRREGTVYTGVMYRSRPLDNVLSIVRSKYPDSRIDLYGKGDIQYINHLCAAYGCSYKGRYEMSDEVSIISNYERGVLSYPMDSLNNTFCAPNKVFSYKLAGCKIVCDSPNTLKLELLTEGLLA
ncbi:MAG: hypothetical protein CO175_08220 [Verrucomicrobia bacterium CG_4_9_14_3_um_filter_43_20]|nr:glycosyltransferase family 4 protein [Bacteroidota bacterium]PJA43412.1 MAG: hypothetical protein CO175_08220 [Verrucomicrobia bacterium CG_4_9_14_3_um_filter_43_20]